MESHQPKLLLIGFDGLDYELYKQFRDSDCTLLPSLAPIPVTGPSWTSIYTGDSMATHGVRDVYGFEFRRRYSHNDFVHLARWYIHNFGLMLRRKPALKRWATCQTTGSTHIWRTLSDAGLSLKTIAMPISCHAVEVNGTMISGFPVVDRKQWFYPPSIADKIPADYKELADMVHWFSDPERDKHSYWGDCLRELGIEAAKPRIIETTDRLLEFFISLPAADVEMIQFSFIDRMGHGFDMADEVMEFCYARVNALVRKLTEAREPGSTVIVSDHGFQGDDHTDYGVLALAGEIADRVHIPEGYTPSVLDIAPTLAGFLGTEHPCEGNNLTIESSYVTRNDESEAREKEQMKEHLRNLGYL